jgi:hypothetical protein
MLSKEILEAQESIELPAREMMDFNVSLIGALQGNANFQASAVCSINVAQQTNGIVVTQSN